MKAYVTMVAAALLFAGGARAGDGADPVPTGRGTEDHLRLRDGTGDGVPDRDRDRLHDRAEVVAGDVARERARERMHEALAEHAPGVRPAQPAGGAAMRDLERERDRMRDEMATRAAERHAKRVGAGEAGHRREGEHVGPGAHQGEMRHEECGEAADHHRMTQMREGGMDGMGGMGGGGMDRDRH